MAHTMEYQELLKRFDTFEAQYATKDFVRAEIAEVRTEVAEVRIEIAEVRIEVAGIRTEIKSVENRLLNRVSVGAILIITAIIGGYFV